jgi:hypothetical protein
VAVTSDLPAAAAAAAVIAAAAAESAVTVTILVSRPAATLGDSEWGRDISVGGICQ